MIRLLASTTFLLVIGGAASAQTGSAAVSMSQLSAPDRPGAATAPAQAASSASLGPGGREALVSAGAPIGEGRPTAEAAPDVSTRAQGRAVATAPVGGRDQCDAGSPAAQTTLCQQRLEAHAAEYGKTGAAPVTAEARLLILTNPQPPAQSVDQATRRLGSSPGVDTLAGSAASTIAGVLNGMTGGAAPTPSAGTAAGAAASVLPAGVPSSVVVGPR